MHSQTRALAADTLADLCELDSCTVSNAIEHFDVRTRNEGFVYNAVRCFFPQMKPVAGYAVTATVRSSMTPVSGRCYYDRPDWWEYVASIPHPRFVVLQDVDDQPGLGALFGEIHANISRALGCCALVTNGAVRDLPGIQAAGLQVFAGSASVSHAYAHIVEFGKAVEIGQLQIRPGDLLHGDRHGIVLVPHDIATEIPRVASEILKSEKDLIHFCRSSEFSLEQLRKKLEHAPIPGRACGRRVRS
jgi:4-hydroxy-4-methyl-2-oxoglutarate aldolase